MQSLRTSRGAGLAIRPGPQSLFCGNDSALKFRFLRPLSNGASPEIAHSRAERGNRDQFAKLRPGPFDPALRAPLSEIRFGGGHLFILAGPCEAKFLQHVSIERDPEPAYFPEVRSTENSPT